MAANVLNTVVNSARIGRYFTVVSALPSALFISYTYLLLASGAWSGPVRFDLALDGLDLRSGTLLAILSFTAAIALHPLQFTLIQLLEGYWGRSALARGLAFTRVRHHRQVLASLREESAAASNEIDDSDDNLSSLRLPDHLVKAVIRRREAERLRVSYPRDPEHILPTRLGNVLRSYEVAAGSPYGIDMISAVPRFGMVAEDRELQYVTSQRTQLELAVRVAVLALVAAVLTAVVMWRHGGWLLLALVPYAVAYLAYRGAVVAAHEYGTALTVMIDLNRFSLYERLHLKPPGSLDEERDLNSRLTAVFQSDLPKKGLAYENPAPPTPIILDTRPGSAGPAGGPGDAEQ